MGGGPFPGMRRRGSAGGYRPVNNRSRPCAAPATHPRASSQWKLPLCVPMRAMRARLAAEVTAVAMQRTERARSMRQQQNLLWRGRRRRRGGGEQANRWGSAERLYAALALCAPRLAHTLERWSKRCRGARLRWPPAALHSTGTGRCKFQKARSGAPMRIEAVWTIAAGTPRRQARWRPALSKVANSCKHKYSQQSNASPLRGLLSLRAHCSVKESLGDSGQESNAG